MASVKVGDHVFADFGSGKVLAHVLDDGHENDAGETKYDIQNPSNGAGEELTLRDPSDRDEAGSGRTFWPLDAV